eukprot:g5667.t1
MAKLSNHRSALSTKKEKDDCCASCYSKCYLFIINISTLILASVLIYYGATTITISNKAKDVGNATASEEQFVNSTNTILPSESSLGTAQGASSIFENAWVTVVAMGCSLFILSFVGIAGTVTRKKFILFTHLVLLMVFSSALLYSAFYCFFFSDNAQALVDYYWHYLADGLPEKDRQTEMVKWVEDHIRGAGIVCLIAALMLLASMCATSQLLGHLYTFRNFMLVVNSATFIIGVLVILLAVITGLEHLTGLWVPYFLAVLGSLMSLLSGLGYCAVRKENSKLMRAYFCSLLILILLFFASSILSFYYAAEMRSYVKSEWPEIEDKIAPGYTEEDVEIILSHHMYKLGIAAAIVVVILIFNSCGSCYMYRRIRYAEAALDDEELEVLRLEEGIDSDDDSEE